MSILKRVFKTLSASAGSFYINNKVLAESEKPTASDKEWQQYWQNTRNINKVEPVYSRVLTELKRQHPKKELKVLDLGTGAGVVARFAAKTGKSEKGECGFLVTAEDMHENALTITRIEALKENLEQCITTRKHDLSEPRDPSQTHEIFNAVLARTAFPFVKPEVSLDKVIKENVLDKLAPGGTAVLEFFGPKHPWCSKKARCNTEEEIRGFFPTVKQIEIEESLKNISLANNEQSTWHELTVIVKK